MVYEGVNKKMLGEHCSTIIANPWDYSKTQKGYNYSSSRDYDGSFFIHLRRILERKGLDGTLTVVTHIVQEHFVTDFEYSDPLVPDKLHDFTDKVLPSLSARRDKKDSKLTVLLEKRVIAQLPTDIDVGWIADQIMQVVNDQSSQRRTLLFRLKNLITNLH